VIALCHVGMLSRTKLETELQTEIRRNLVWVYVSVINVTQNNIFIWRRLPSPFYVFEKIFYVI